MCVNVYIITFITVATKDIYHSSLLDHYRTFISNIKDKLEFCSKNDINVDKLFLFRTFKNIDIIYAAQLLI